MAQHWSLNVQQDLGFGTLTVGYVGNHVTHLLTDGVITPRNSIALMQSPARAR
jgi:hypothetical protein